MKDTYQQSQPSYQIATLEKTIVIWRWLAKYPRKSKENAYHVLKLSPDLCSCPLCEYTVDKRLANKRQLMRCELCLLQDFWPEGKCSLLESPYTIWQNSPTAEGATIAAQAIADAAQAKLNEVRNDRS